MFEIKEVIVNFIQTNCKPNDWKIDSICKSNKGLIISPTIEKLIVNVDQIRNS